MKKLWIAVTLTLIIGMLAAACGSRSDGGADTTSTQEAASGSQAGSDNQTGSDSQASGENGASQDNGGTAEDIVAVDLGSYVPDFNNIVPIPDVSGKLSVFTRTDQFGGNPIDGPVRDYFAEFYPGLVLDEVYINDYWAQNIMTEHIAAGTAPDVFITRTNTAQMIAYRELNYAAPLNDYINADPAHFSKLREYAIEDNRLDDGLVYAITIMTFPGGLYSNTELLDIAGVPHPTNNWNIDELLEAARQVTDKSAPRVAIPFGISDPEMLAGLLIGNNIECIIEENGQMRSAISENPAAMELLQKWVELTSDSRYALTAEEAARSGVNWSTQWTNGIVAFVPWGIWAQPWDAANQREFFVTKFTEFPAGVKNAEALCIYSGSNQKDLAMDYIKIITSQHFLENAVGISTTPEGVTNYLRYIPDPNSGQLPEGINSLNKIYSIGGGAAVQETYENFWHAAATQADPVFGGVGQHYTYALGGKLAEVEDRTVQFADAMIEFDREINENFFFD